MESSIICRACSTEITQQYIDIDSPFNDGTVLEIFNFCTNLQASSEDALPNTICIPCGTSLQTAYDFIKIAYETDQMLRDTFILEQEKDTLQHSTQILSADDQYIEEYIEDIDNIEIKEEEEGTQYEVLTLKDEIDVESLDEDQKQNYQYYFESTADSPQTNEFDNDSLIPACQRVYNCDTCEKPFKTMLSRNKHEFLEHKEEDSKNRKCKLCNFSTSSLSSWQTHRYRHENPTKKKYLCSYCPQRFVNPKSLYMHEDYHHGNKEQAAKCEKCQKKFMNKQKLEYHILSAHSNGRNYLCPQCPKTFKNNFQLKAHQKLHTNRTIQCPQCEKKFLRHVDLKVHMRTHTGELPYQCHLCDKRYRIKVRLTYHLQKHSGIKHRCEICSNEFNSRPRLRLHMFDHIGMPFVCDHCQMGFRNRLGLSRHSKNIHNIILTDDDLLQNRLKNEKNIKRGIVSDNALFGTSNAEEELEI